GNSPVIYYELQMRTTAIGSTYSVVGSGSQVSTSLSFKVTNLQIGPQYVFRVRAFNNAGFGPFSAESTAKSTLVTVAGPPGVITLLSRTETSLHLSWTAPV